MWQCQGDVLCEQYCSLTTGLVDSTKIEYSLATGRLQDRFSHVSQIGMSELRTFYLLYFHCYFLHED
jgi:hypothetical protein